MTETTLAILIIALMATPLVVAGVSVAILLNKNLSPYEKMDTSFRITFAGLLIAFAIVFFIFPRRWWLWAVIGFVVTAAYMWLINRGGHILEDERRRARQDVTRATENEDDAPST
ncbi:MAG: hypothetical protein IMW98_04485 [Firmicutes bacterium]|nr:hypothetical protein [Bacillota bacterium]